ncbi:ribosome recycling factor [Ganoderma leucocontextum]|nr:ribosome recycling factor [Ganoderma leucocontextum]
MSAAALIARTRLFPPSGLPLLHAQCRSLAARRATLAVHQVRSYAKPAKSKDKDKGKGKDKERDDVPQAGKKGGKGFSTDELIPASQRIAASADYKATESKMQGVLDWFRKEVAALETRATGRVTPALLSPVRVKLPDATDARGVRLEEVATVGVKEGTTLLVTVFEEHSLKYVEQAIYDAKLPSITPQKVDSRTIKIPIPKPTVETRNALYTTASRQAEDVRVQLRKLHQALLKKADVSKRSADFSTYQTLSDKCMGELDNILAHLKKATS